VSEQSMGRGAAEEASGIPVTETEERASERPPSIGDAESLAADDPAAGAEESDAGRDEAVG
jgi:hypothetical protein